MLVFIPSDGILGSKNNKFKITAGHIQRAWCTRTHDFSCSVNQREIHAKILKTKTQIKRMDRMNLNN